MILPKAFVMINQGLCVIHCGKADVSTIGYLQPNMPGISNDQIL